MAAVPNMPLVSIDDYLASSYPDGDREYLDGRFPDSQATTNASAMLAQAK